MKRVLIALVAGSVVVLFLSRHAMLHRGASTGQKVLISIALVLGADANWYASDGNTPLLTAAATRQIAAVKRLIAAGANVNKENRQTGATPLMIAARLGDEPIVDALLAAGASVSARDKEDRTAYTYAFRNNQSAVARKVHYVRTAEVTLPPPANVPGVGGDQSDWVDGKPPNYVKPEVTNDSPVTITDTTGWTPIAPNLYMKRVTREEAQKLNTEHQRQVNEARAEARRKMDAAAQKNPPR